MTLKVDLNKPPIDHAQEPKEVPPMSHHRPRIEDSLLTRREALCRAGMGFGSLALGSLMAVLIFAPVLAMAEPPQPQEEPEDDIVVLRRLEENGANNAEAGDLIEIATVTDASDGPFHLRVEIDGKGVTFRVKPIIVLVIPTPPDPDNPKPIGPSPEFRAYFTVEGAGEVTFVVTPVFPPGKAKAVPRRFPVTISKKGSLRSPAGPPR